MSHPTQEDVTLQGLANALRRLRHLQEKVEGLWQDFFAEEPELLPREVAHVQRQRATEALDQQIEKALLLAFGSDSPPLHQFRAVGFLPASTRSLMDVQLLLDRIVCDLQQRRLKLLQSTSSPDPASGSQRFTVTESGAPAAGAEFRRTSLTTEPG